VPGECLRAVGAPGAGASGGEGAGRPTAYDAVHEQRDGAGGPRGGYGGGRRAVRGGGGADDRDGDQQRADGAGGHRAEQLRQRGLAAAQPGRRQQPGQQMGGEQQPGGGGGGVRGQPQEGRADGAAAAQQIHPQRAQRPGDRAAAL